MRGSPLTELPIVGGIVELVNTLLRSLGFPAWIAQFLEFLLLACALYLLLGLLLFRVLPWLSRTLVEPVLTFVDIACATLLLPEFLVTRNLRRDGRPPTPGIYLYGEVVLGIASRVETLARRGVPLLRHAERLPEVSPLVLLAVVYLLWNATSCYAPNGSECLSPLAAWGAEVEAWFKWF